MKRTVQNLIAAMLLATALPARAQGFVYDQQSATGPATVQQIDGFNLQEDSPLTQSFIPTLSAIGFIQLQFFDISGNGTNGATVDVNLWMGSPNTNSATFLGSTAPVYIPNGFGNNGFSAAVTNFYFLNAVALTSGQTYYFQPVVLSGDDPWDIVVLTNTYLNGKLFAHGAALQPGSDFWFREGIVSVPEPSIFVFVGVSILFVFGFKRHSRVIILLLFAGSILSVHAAGDSIVKATADKAGLTPVAVASLPSTGTFFVITTGAKGQIMALPYPTLPSGLSDLPIYLVSENAFMVDNKIKILLSNHAHEFSRPWLSAPSNPMKCSRPLARLRPNIYSLMPPFRPIAPDSSARACDARGFSGLKFGGVKMPQRIT